MFFGGGDALDVKVSVHSETKIEIIFGIIQAGFFKILNLDKTDKNEKALAL